MSTVAHEHVQPGQSLPASRVEMSVEQAQLFPGFGTSVVSMCQTKTGSKTQWLQGFSSRWLEQHDSQPQWFFGCTGCSLLGSTMYFALQNWVCVPLFSIRGFIVGVGVGLVWGVKPDMNVPLKDMYQ